MSQAIDGFNFILNLNARPMKMYRAGGTEQSLRVATSNYQRNQALAQDLVSNDREYVISKKEIDKTTYVRPKRGDKLIDVDFGTVSITQIVEMVIMGELVGYRIRAN
jgi:hypothetical protein